MTLKGVIRYRNFSTALQENEGSSAESMVELEVPVSKSILIREMAIRAMQIHTQSHSNGRAAIFIQLFPEPQTKQWPRDGKIMWQAIVSWLTAMDKTAISDHETHQLGTKTLSTQNTLSIDFMDAGTPARLFTAMAATSQIPVKLSGNDSLQSRSMQPLIDALKSAGATIEYLDKTGYFPIKISQPLQALPKQITVDQSFSSQYLSALSIIAKFLPGHCEIIPSGEPHSLQYWELTQKMLENFNPMSTPSISLSGDWSAASFFYGLSASLPNLKMGISPLSVQQLQSDEAAVSIFSSFGVETEQLSQNRIVIHQRKRYSESTQKSTFDSLPGTSATINKTSEAIHETTSTNLGTYTPSFNMENNPDMVPVLVISALLQEKPIQLQNINNLKFKESNRLEALIEICSTLGASLQTLDNSQNDFYHLQIPQNGIQWPQSISLNTRNDHRLAMSFSLLATKIASVELNDISCVEKSFPNYWDQLRLCNFEITI